MFFPTQFTHLMVGVQDPETVFYHCLGVGGLPLVVEVHLLWGFLPRIQKGWAG